MTTKSEMKVADGFGHCGILQVHLICPVQVIDVPKRNTIDSFNICYKSLVEFYDALLPTVTHIV